MNQLIAKLIAAGLSAAVVLLWWPHVFHADGGTSWLMRAVAWTLLYELLFMAIAPLEALLWAHTRAGKRLAAQAARLKARLTPDGSPHRQFAAMTLVALVAVAVPLGLIVRGEPVAEESAEQIEHVTKVVEVNRPVQKIIQTVPGTTASAPAADEPAAAASLPAPASRAKRPVAPKRADAGADQQPGRRPPTRERRPDDRNDQPITPSAPVDETDDEPAPSAPTSTSPAAPAPTAPADEPEHPSCANCTPPAATHAPALPPAD